MSGLRGVDHFNSIATLSIVSVNLNGSRGTHCFGATAPVSFNLPDLTQPDTLLPVLGLTYITDDHPSFVWAYAINSSFGMTKTPSIGQRKFGAE
jgi:hypothetical protein